MKRQHNFLLNSFGQGNSLLFILTCFFFFLGSCLGAYASINFSFESFSVLSQSTELNSSGFLNVISAFKFPLFVFLCGVSLFGVFIIPVLAFLKGYSLTFSVAFCLYSEYNLLFSNDTVLLLTYFFFSALIILLFLYFSFKASYLFFIGVCKSKRSFDFLPLYFKETCVSFLFLVLLYILNSII